MSSFATKGQRWYDWALIEVTDTEVGGYGWSIGWEQRSETDLSSVAQRWPTP
jgi:hypothetical protein